MDVFYWIAVAIVTVGASARLTRLVIHDDFPPIAWFRDKMLDRFETSSWSLLLVCPYCLSFWTTLLVFGLAPSPSEADAPWAFLWWWIAGALAFSYVSAEIVWRDKERN